MALQICSSMEIGVCLCPKNDALWILRAYFILVVFFKKSKLYSLGSMSKMNYNPDCYNLFLLYTNNSLTF